jgi:hypothetical protein
MSIGERQQGITHNVWIAETEWKRGCRVINVYDDKSVVFASKVKKK